MKKLLILYSLLLLNFYCFSQEQKKDTLFIKYNNSLLTKFQYPKDNNFYHKIKGTGNDGFTYFIEDKIYNNLKTKNILCFKNVLETSDAYLKNNKLLDSKLAKYLEKYIIFLIKENKYIEVQVVHEIE